MSKINKKLHRLADSWVGGVLSGIGKYVGIDGNILRILFILGFSWHGDYLFVAYIIAWCLIPNEDGENIFG